MQLTNEFQTIRDWANERNLYKTATNKSQLTKLFEEMAELYAGITSGDQIEIADAIGDCIVVLTNLASINGLKVEDCINHAYMQIKDRKGKMVNGTFVKE
jgi:NTP pyrophosphatase (non-canonical NTP hydrolase)